MSKLPPVLQKLSLPVIGSPLFIISNPKLVIEQCKAGIVGSMPALNARPAELLDDWLAEITETLAAWGKGHPAQPPAPFALNKFAHKAVEKGADGLIAVAAGAGGHAGVKSPFALIQEVREWFDGPLALSGSISTGGGVLAAQAMGADFAYIGSAFIATHEARAAEAYKQAIVEGSSDDIIYSNLFTGVHGNYLAPSIRAAGLDPENLPVSDPSKMNFGTDRKAWKDIWGCGQGIGAIRAVTSAAELVARLRSEYEAARARLLAR